MDELEALFEMDKSGKKLNFTFHDEDYTEKNKTVNRVRNYSFSKVPRSPYRSPNRSPVRSPVKIPNGN